MPRNTSHSKSYMDNMKFVLLVVLIWNILDSGWSMLMDNEILTQIQVSKSYVDNMKFALLVVLMWNILDSDEEILTQIQVNISNTLVNES